MALSDNISSNVAGSKDFRKYTHTVGRVYTHPAGRVYLVLQDECLLKSTSPALISTRPFSDQFILRVSKRRFLPSDFGSLLELMPVFLSGISYDLR